MKTALANLSEKLRLLEAFEEKYQPGERLVCVHALEQHAPPYVTFYRRDRDWALSTFGVTGWQEDGASRGYRYMNVCKLVDGVLVSLDEAYEIQPSPEPCEVPSSLLTGAEAGIDLLSTSVRDAHPASDPLCVMPAILEARK